MPIRRPAKQSILEFVDALATGTRVIWIANGAAGTVQPDKSILWDDGYHMTRKDMRDQHALLIHSEAEKKQLRRALETRLKCLRSGCKLVHWDDDTYQNELPERLCPLAVLTVPREPPPKRAARPQRHATTSPQPSAA